MTTAAPRIVASGVLVRLREKTLDDARRDYMWRRDEELARYDAAVPIATSFRNFVTTLSEDLANVTVYRRSFAIEDSASGRHIGNIMYYGYDPVRRDAEIGITIGDRAYWGRGYGTDALRAMLHYLFVRRGMHRAFLHTLTWNERAQAAFLKAGFRPLRTVRRDGKRFELMEIHRDQYDPGGERTQRPLPGQGS